MKVVQINTTCGIGSTGRICVAISRKLTDENIENYILYSSKTNEFPLGISCSGKYYTKLQAAKAKLFGNYGFQSRRATRRIIAELERIQPDIVHLHNIHGHDCHLGILFQYFQKKQTKLIWTFHDCWAFTGYCPYFTYCRCNKWQVKCGNCAQKKTFSWLFDRSRELVERKKKLFSGLDLTIVTPSQWLASLIKSSFLKEYPVCVFPNGIDLQTFRPYDSSFRQKYGLENKKIVLGVSYGWDERKGIDVFFALARRLPADYQIVLVGTNKGIDQKLPDSILSIHQTHDPKELAEIYTAADVFVNPTREENYPTVNMEAVACGTPVVTFRTGGSPEMLDKTCGIVVEYNDLNSLENEIRRVCTNQVFSPTQCVAKAQEYDENLRLKEYLELYAGIIAKRAEGN